MLAGVIQQLARHKIKLVQFVFFQPFSRIVLYSR